MNHFIYHQAPDLLLEKIAELEAIIDKTRYRNPNQESLKFYESVINVMKYAYSYTQEVEWVFRDHQNFRGLLGYYKERNEYLENKLASYDAIEASMIKGDFEEHIAAVTAHMAKIQSIKNRILNTKKEKLP